MPLHLKLKASGESPSLLAFLFSSQLDCSESSVRPVVIESGFELRFPEVDHQPAGRCAYQSGLN